MEAILRRASSISFLSSLSLCFLPDNLVLASEITFHCWASLCFSASMAFIIASTSCCKWETHTFCEISRKYCRIFLYTKLDFNNRLSMYRFSEKKGASKRLRTCRKGCCEGLISSLFRSPSFPEKSSINRKSAPLLLLDFKRLLKAILAFSETRKRCSFSTTLWRCFLSCSKADFWSWKRLVVKTFEFNSESKCLVCAI